MPRYKAATKPSNIKHHFNDRQEGFICELIYNEYDTAKSNQSQDIADFEANIDILENVRSEKEYDWMSDVSFPEYASIVLTESALWANEYFKTRDFVNTYLEESTPETEMKCKGVKTLLNKTLNRKDLFYYHKYIRAKTICSVARVSYALCWWEQDIKPVQVGTNRVIDGYDFDEEGNMMTNSHDEPVMGDNIVRDHFNFEVLDPRNVFVDNKYSYSIQQKDWIIIRSEKTYEELKAKERENGYFNLDLVKEIVDQQKKSNKETTTAQETYNKQTRERLPARPFILYFDVLERYGKIWVVFNKDGTVEPGWDDQGNLNEKAVLVEGISTIVFKDNHKIMIRFEETKFKDSKGMPYKPIVRGLNYIHPTKDVGMCDAKYSRELQVAMNDGINLCFDRTRLATLPTMKGNKYALEDNDSIFFEPEHTMMLENPQTDLEEFKISDNIQGMMDMVTLCINKMQQINAVFPTTMGQLPEAASTTATAVAGAETRTNLRANYKSLTFEYTFLTDFYWMILQMTYRFAREETAMKLLGQELAMAFDPEADYSYQPVSANIEMEYNKYRKIALYDQMLGRVTNLQHPGIVKVINYIIQRICELMGDEYPMINKMLLNENVPIQPEGQGAKDMGQGTQNQFGMPQQNMEMSARGTLMPGMSPALGMGL